MLVFILFIDKINRKCALLRVLAALKGNFQLRYDYCGSDKEQVDHMKGLLAYQIFTHGGISITANLERDVLMYKGRNDKEYRGICQVPGK